jgi:hypothetical protein
MIRTTAAASFALVVVTSALSPDFAAGEKTPQECDDNYLDEMANNFDALEVLVPNVPPEEASYIDKEYSAAIQSKAGQRIYAIEHRPLFPA